MPSGRNNKVDNQTSDCEESTCMYNIYKNCLGGSDISFLYTTEHYVSNVESY